MKCLSLSLRLPSTHTPTHTFYPSGLVPWILTAFLKTQLAFLRIFSFGLPQYFSNLMWIHIIQSSCCHVDLGSVNMAQSLWLWISNNLQRKANTAPQTTHSVARAYSGLVFGTNWFHKGCCTKISHSILTNVNIYE